MSEYPYQIVCFLGKEPKVGETVYSGENGWYPQLALKRRFKFLGMDEDAGLTYIEEFCQRASNELRFTSGELVSDDRMPVKYIQIKDDGIVSSFHGRFIDFMGDRIESRYPDREGPNYMPHITAEYNNEMVIDVQRYTNKDFVIHRVCILKDVEGENSIAYEYFNLGENHSFATMSP